MNVFLNADEPIVTSLLDNDLYKFTMLQAMLHQFPQTHGVYRFRCRNNHETAFPLGEIKADLEQQLDYLCQLKFTQDELDYLRGLRFIKSDFVDYLELFSLKRRFITVSTDDNNFLNIDIEGPMIQAMFFEIFVLCIVSELYYRRLVTDDIMAEGQKRLDAKIALLRDYQAKQSAEPMSADKAFTGLILGRVADSVKRGNIMWSNRFMRHALRSFVVLPMFIWLSSLALRQLGRWRMSLCKPFKLWMCD